MPGPTSRSFNESNEFKEADIGAARTVTSFIGSVLLKKMPIGSMDQLAIMSVGLIGNPCSDKTLEKYKGIDCKDIRSFMGLTKLILSLSTHDKTGDKTPRWKINKNEERVDFRKIIETGFSKPLLQPTPKEFCNQALQVGRKDSCMSNPESEKYCKEVLKSVKYRLEGCQIHATREQQNTAQKT